MTDLTADRFIRRARELQQTGLDMSHAFGLASFEERIENWPSGWGSEFIALVFGDFEPPATELTFESLGIVVEPTKVQDTIIKTARTVLRARVQIPEKSVSAVRDATRRLNLLVGVLSATNQGAPIRWWSYITSSSGGGVGFRLGDQDASTTLALVQHLPPEPRSSVSAALYWIREPRGMLLEHDRSDEFAVFAGYWNAFECLVEAGDTLRPRVKASQAEKTKAIADRLRDVTEVTPEHISSLYRDVVDPGFRAKAAHVLRTWLPGEAEHFLTQCFQFAPRDRGLYALRNAINHGTIDINDPEATLIINVRFPELWRLDFSLFRSILVHNLTGGP